MHITGKYFITWTLKCFALAVAAISAELRAKLLNITYSILRYILRFFISYIRRQCC